MFQIDKIRGSFYILGYKDYKSMPLTKSELLRGIISFKLDDKDHEVIESSGLWPSEAEVERVIKEIVEERHEHKKPCPGRA